MAPTRCYMLAIVALAPTIIGLPFFSVRQRSESKPKPALVGAGRARRVDLDLRLQPAGGLTITSTLHDAAAGTGVGQAPAEGQ